jgi:tetratricopeptide (TPR) repeat protein
MTTVHRAAALLPVDPEAARALLQDILDLDPSRATREGIIAGNLQLILDETTAKAPDLVFLSDELNRLRMPQLAVALGGVLLAREPQSIAGRLVLSSAFDGLQYYDLSMEHLNHAAAALRESPEASAPFTVNDLTASFGRTYLRMGEFRKAVDQFLASGDADRFVFALGLAYQGLEEFEKAYSAFQRSIELGEPEQQVAQARRHLERDEYDPFRPEP